MKKWFILTYVLFAWCSLSHAQLTTFDAIGGFEGTEPGYWTAPTPVTGATMTWATDQSRHMGRSLKITKTATSTAAVWQSENMVDLWAPQILANVDITLGAWVMTQGVNTNPTTDDQRWFISYTFYDSAGAVIGQEFKLPIPQTTASTGAFVADTNAAGSVILPVDAWKVVIKFYGGKDATGTVWADDFVLYGRGGAWAGQDWNTAVGVPTGWNYWLPPNGGNDGLLANGFENTRLTTEAAHSGSTSLKFYLPANRETHDAWVGTRRIPLDATIQQGDLLQVSVWIKASGLKPDSQFANQGTWSVGLTPIFHSGYKNNDPYDEIGAKDLVFPFPRDTAFDWTQFSVTVRVPDTPIARNFSVRIHIYSRMVGTLYFDDLQVRKLTSVVANINDVGGFEGTEPAYWTAPTPVTGATMTWATDQSRHMGRSLKINKTATSTAAAWVSENMVDLWAPQILANVDITLGAWVMTQGVNTNPTTDDQRWFISYTFYDSAGAMIGQEFKLPIPQTTASTGAFVADTNAAGSVILPVDAWKVIIKFYGGKDATGTVWADDFVLYGRGGAWAGQDWNTAVGVPTGWNYWLPPNGGNDALLANGFENTRLTTEAAHSGTTSLKFYLPANRETHDAWVGTRRFPLDPSVHQGDLLQISVWIKASGLMPDSQFANQGTWSVGLTPIFHSGFKNNDPYDELGAHDLVFPFPRDTAFDWTQFSVTVQVPDTPIARYLSVRIHIYSRMVGTLYWDDLTVMKANPTGIKDGTKIYPAEFAVYQNYPNPFNPTTTISYTMPQTGNVSVKIYDILGREVKTLFDGDQMPGIHSVIWNGDNNYGSKVASGTYIYVVRSGEKFQVKKMILLK